MFCRVLMTIALVCAIPSAYSYSAGAPEQACGDMIPQHHVEPQSSSAPYKIILSDEKLLASENKPVSLKIKGNTAGDTIKGFMVQARIGDKPVGKFQVPKKNAKHAQLLSCSGGSGNALTHKKMFGSGPNEIETLWTKPPGITGDVKFYATVALNGGIFWVDKLIETLTIS